MAGRHLSGLEGQMDVLKPPAPQVVLADHEVDTASVAPYHAGPFLGVDLKQQQPIGRSSVKPSAAALFISLA